MISDSSYHQLDSLAVARSEKGRQFQVPTALGPGPAPAVAATADRNLTLPNPSSISSSCAVVHVIPDGVPVESCDSSSLLSTSRSQAPSIFPVTSTTALNVCRLIFYFLNIILMVFLFSFPLYYLHSHSDTITKGYWNRIVSSGDRIDDFPSGSSSYHQLAERRGNTFSTFSLWADSCADASQAFGLLLGVALACHFFSFVSLARRIQQRRESTIRSVLLERVLVTISQLCLILSFVLFHRGCIDKYSTVSTTPVQVEIGWWPAHVIVFGITWIITFILWAIRDSGELPYSQK